MHLKEVPIVVRELEEPPIGTQRDRAQGHPKSKANDLTSEVSPKAVDIGMGPGDGVFSCYPLVSSIWILDYWRV